MPENSASKLETLITIMDEDLEDVLIDVFEEVEAPVVLFTYGYGTVKSKIYEMLGYGGPKKVISISVHSPRMSREILDRLDREIDLCRPGTGIGFTISLSSVSKMLSKVCTEADGKLEIGSEDMIITSKEPYHLIIAIVNSGYFEEVMDAAKAAGANGGTVVHARSLGSKEATKYLGITVQPEKDLVLILAKRENKLAIMESITSKAGINTAAVGCCFSLPVNETLGTDSILENFCDL